MKLEIGLLCTTMTLLAGCASAPAEPPAAAAADTPPTQTAARDEPPPTGTRINRGGFDRNLRIIDQAGAREDASRSSVIGNAPPVR